MNCPYAPNGWIIVCPCQEFDDCDYKAKLRKEYDEEDDQWLISTLNHLALMKKHHAKLSYAPQNCVRSVKIMHVPA